MRSRAGVLLAIFAFLRAIGCSDENEEIETTPFPLTAVPDELSVRIEDACGTLDLPQVSVEASMLLPQRPDDKCFALDARASLNGNSLTSEVKLPGAATNVCRRYASFKDIVRADPATYDVRFESEGIVRHLIAKIDREVDVSIAKPMRPDDEIVLTIENPAKTAKLAVWFGEHEIAHDLEAAETVHIPTNGVRPLSGDGKQQVRVCYTAPAHITRCDARTCRADARLAFAFHTNGTQ